MTGGDEAMSAKLTQANFMVRQLTLMVLLLAVALQVQQTLAQTRLPAPKNSHGSSTSNVSAVNKKARYLIYISGYIVHAGNRRPTSPRFGVYEYEKILERFKQQGFVVISEAREQSSELEPHARTISRHIERLLTDGVPPQQITIVGASQGAWIAMLVSTQLKNQNLSFVLLGSCAADDGLLKVVDLHGKVLFISERTDLPGSCERFRADATGLSKYKFLEINTGQKHGFLFRPIDEWVLPTIAWAERKSITIH